MTERTKKIILWSLIVIMVAVLFFWWIKNVQKKIGSFKADEFIKELNFPAIEMPEFPKLEEIIKNAQKISTTTEKE